MDFKILKEQCSIDCTGDVVVGDTIFFQESIFGGSYKKPKYLGDRYIIAEVIRDSYGSKKQQHTFTLKVLACIGEDSQTISGEIRRKGRNIYRNKCYRMPYKDINLRNERLKEKHHRGKLAREDRNRRIEETALGSMLYE